MNFLIVAIKSGMNPYSFEPINFTYLPKGKRKIEHLYRFNCDIIGAV